MTAESTAYAGRTAALRLMQDTFTIYAPSGNVLGDDGMEGPGFSDEGTTVGKLSGPTGASRDTAFRTVRVGGVDRPVIEGGLHIPLDAPVPAAGAEGTGWEFECTAVGPASDPALLGRRWRVVDAPAKSFATARRLDVVEIPQEA